MEGDGTRLFALPFDPVSRGSLQGWKGSVKATHFVIALHDYFTAKASRKAAITNTSSAEEAPAKAPADALADAPADAPTDAPAGTVNTDTTSLPDTAVEDSWALEYITVRLIQPLVEAIDDDASSFVTVSELNDFTSSRPKGWRRVFKIMIHSYCLTYHQSSSLDRILDHRL